MRAVGNAIAIKLIGANTFDDPRPIPFSIALQVRRHRLVIDLPMRPILNQNFDSIRMPCPNPKSASVLSRCCSKTLVIMHGDSLRSSLIRVEIALIVVVDLYQFMPPRRFCANSFLLSSKRLTQKIGKATTTHREYAKRLFIVNASLHTPRELLDREPCARV